MLTQERLKEVLHYDPDTGIFTWIKAIKGSSGIGKIANSKFVHYSGKIYQRICFDRKRIFSHRLAWLYIHGYIPEDSIDHINGDTQDNRILNLREVSALENLKNAKKSIHNKSGTTGVSWNKQNKRWVAQIRAAYKYIYLGSFINIENAISARKEAEIKYGFHKNHGRNIIAP